MRDTEMSNMKTGKKGARSLTAKEIDAVSGGYFGRAVRVARTIVYIGRLRTPLPPIPRLWA